MKDFSLLHSYFEKINNRLLSIEEKKEISGVFKKEIFKKKEIIFSEGDIDTGHFYIEKGLIRLYIMDQAGKEFNVLFAKEKQWIGDLGSPAATPYYLEAVENCVVYSIKETGFESIFAYYKDFANNIRRSYVFLQKRFVSILSKTAEENYEELIKQSPELVQRLPQYHISSYLGVTPVFLSKIISKRARKKDK